MRRSAAAATVGGAASQTRSSPNPSAPTPARYQLLLRALARLDRYLRAPLEHELAREPQLRESRRRFLDGDQLTLADCGLLPKLHIVDVSAGRARESAGGRVAPSRRSSPRPRPSPADGVRALPPGAHPHGAARRPPLPGQRAAGEGIQVHMSAHFRDPGGLPARRASPLGTLPPPSPLTRLQPHKATSVLQ